ncbi:PREDICTED: protein cereblon homolog [Papilio xuthus]|uniref:Protein cereblon homolog n=1 Tax=Papilio xuthus TaxID=66420 RepID=A0AAJ6Z7G7_PAPXU|nr:PREDICTED: protein cereblon homolog [Papilio xuthus]
MIFILFVLGSLYFPCVTRSEYSNHTFKNTIVCRSCGNNITSTEVITSKRSSESSHSFEEAVFNDDNVLIQLLSKDNFEFHVITTLQATCENFGQWQEEELWYPGYQWKPCICPECGTFVGWVYKSSDIELFRPQIFYVLIASSLISDSLIDSLIVYPKI